MVGLLDETDVSVQCLLTVGGDTQTLAFHSDYAHTHKWAIDPDIPPFNLPQCINT